MSRTIPTSVPRSLIAGDSWQWDTDLPDYPASAGWTVVHSIRGPSALSDVTSQPNALTGVYETRIGASATESLEPGIYHWSRRVSKAGDVFTVASGRFSVVRNLAIVETIESHAAKMVRLLEGALEGQIPADLARFQVGGRTIEAIPVMEKRQLLAQYRAELRRELTPERLSRPVQVQFGEPWR